MGKKTVSGLIVAAPSSGSGKTVVTLSLLRAIRNSGIDVNSVKVGPDYIDPAYHSAASGKSCRNLDFWGMSHQTLIHQQACALGESSLVIGEGVMGLFDGATMGKSEDVGSTAAVAEWLGCPIILVVDATGQGASVAALVQGFANHRKDIEIAGVIFNKIGGPNHELILREALSITGIPCIGCIPKHNSLYLPHRHLGLIQAREINKLEIWLDEAAKIVANKIDLGSLLKYTKPLKSVRSQHSPIDFLPIPVLGQHTAVAYDDAFAFCYDYVLEAWRAHGVELSFFSPIHGETIHSCADSVYLPGGYPELYASDIAANQDFRETMKVAANNGAVIYGECGGYMVLGSSLTDREGKLHNMLDLLPVRTSFVRPRLHLGYRELSLIDGGAFGNIDDGFKGHEFHYCEIVEDSETKSLFYSKNARGERLQSMGCKSGSVMGSFAHIIDAI
jgi:cobyrinic acid a,c-diamide synthase